MKKFLLIGLVIFGSSNVFSEEQMSVNVPRLTLAVANKMAMTALQTCEKKGISVSATVVDRNGIIQAQLRNTMAPPVSLGISFKKSYTAVMFNGRGSQLAINAKSALQSLNEHLAFMAGSIPIKAGGKLYGAIGVSGAPSGKTDEACALAGFNAIAEDLEMQ